MSSVVVQPRVCALSSSRYAMRCTCASFALALPAPALAPPRGREQMNVTSCGVCMCSVCVCVCTCVCVFGHKPPTHSLATVLRTATARRGQPSAVVSGEAKEVAALPVVTVVAGCESDRVG
jgi:hypothetical protein